jgi:hypothetical protein
MLVSLSVDGRLVEATSAQAHLAFRSCDIPEHGAADDGTGSGGALEYWDAG